MRMVFAYNITSLPALKAKLESKAKLTPKESELVKGIKMTKRGGW